jgi:hypothetical protein
MVVQRTTNMNTTKTPDTQAINSNITAICYTFGIAVQSRVTGEGTKTRYVNMPGRTVDRKMASEAIKAIATEMRRANMGAEAMIYTMAAEIVAKEPMVRTKK